MKTYIPSTEIPKKIDVFDVEMDRCKIKMLRHMEQVLSKYEGVPPFSTESVNHNYWAIHALLKFANLGRSIGFLAKLAIRNIKEEKADAALDALSGKIRNPGPFWRIVIARALLNRFYPRWLEDHQRIMEYHYRILK